jgi:hypothetical protein
MTEPYTLVSHHSSPSVAGASLTKMEQRHVEEEDSVQDELRQATNVRLISMLRFGWRPSP